jgi:hypothetical protein
MAFASSRVLRIVTRYSQEINNPYEIDGKKMVYNKERYGYQYSTNLVREGFATGGKFLNRVPRYKKMHPEILNIINFQRYVFVYFILATLVASGMNIDSKNENDAEFEYARGKDLGFVDRYQYRQLDVEFLSNATRNIAI